jgi:hypothetical protein
MHEVLCRRERRLHVFNRFGIMNCHGGRPPRTG